MQLDPQCEAVLKGVEGMPPLEKMTVQESREAARGFTEMMGPPEDVASVADRRVQGKAEEIPVRIYTPIGEGPFPVFVFFHGGWWVFGSAEVVDPISRAICNRAGCIVVSVDYRLAPEHPFPAGLEDCYAATNWVASHAAEIGGDPQRVAVGGDSAGGNLAAVVSLMARDRGGPSLAMQVLVYPVTDYNFDRSSYKENAEGYLVHTAAARVSWERYLDGANGLQPYASPMRAPDLSGLPAVFVATCEFDPLRDEGREYGARLKAAGVRCEQVHCDAQIHGIFWMAGAVDRGRELIDQAGDALRRAFAGG